MSILYSPRNSTGMALITELKIKVFYFEMEIIQQQAYLKQKGLDSSLVSVKDKLGKMTAETYLKSNLKVISSLYEQNPFRLSVIMEGSEHKTNEAINVKNTLENQKEWFTVLMIEIMSFMSSQVKSKIIKKGYKVEEIAGQILFQYWNKTYLSNQETHMLRQYFKRQHGNRYYQKIYFNNNSSVITDIGF